MTSEFVAIAAHELRTPMTSIKAYVSLLLSGRFGELDEKKEKALEVIDRNVDRLVKFTTDILTLSRIQSGRLKAYSTDIDVLTLVKNVLRSFSGPITREDIKVSII
jgi:signal transduction histidine kinase